MEAGFLLAQAERLCEERHFDGVAILLFVDDEVAVSWLGFDGAAQRIEDYLDLGAEPMALFGVTHTGDVRLVPFPGFESEEGKEMLWEFLTKYAGRVGRHAVPLSEFN